MPRKHFRKFLPDHETILAHKWLGKLGSFIQHPALWHLNRRSVSGAVAVGLFAGLIPGPLQMLAAALLAIALRLNLAVALLTTLYTNPFTIVPLYVLAYWIGTLVTGASAASLVAPPEFSWSEIPGWMHGLYDWTMSMGKPLAIGLITLACGLAALGWITVQLAWRAYVVRAWQRRKLRRL